MHVYHLVARANVDSQGTVVDPKLARHGTVERGLVGALAGPIDPLTHLNSNFLDHRLEGCVVVEELVVGAQVHFADDGFRVAYPRATAFQPLGRVDQASRRAAWLAQVDVRAR